LIGFLLDQPEKMLIEFCEFLENCPFPLIILVVLAYLNSSIDDPHDELCVVLIFPGMPLVVQVIADLYTTGEDEVILLVTSSVDFLNGILHPGGPT